MIIRHDRSTYTYAALSLTFFLVLGLAILSQLPSFHPSSPTSQQPEVGLGGQGPKVDSGEKCPDHVVDEWRRKFKAIEECGEAGCSGGAG